MKFMFKQWLAVTVITMAVIPVWGHTKTPVEQCPGESFENLQERIEVLPCDKNRCKLKQDSNITVVFKFAPKKEVESLMNDVYAVIAGISLPFIGVSGTSVCGHVIHADSGTPAACPLAAGREYVYTSVVPISHAYPTISLRVQWSLRDGQRKVICFEVPAVITQPLTNSLL